MYCYFTERHQCLPIFTYDGSCYFLFTQNNCWEFFTSYDVDLQSVLQPISMNIFQNYLNGDFIHNATLLRQMAALPNASRISSYKLTGTTINKQNLSVYAILFTFIFDSINRATTFYFDKRESLISQGENKFLYRNDQASFSCIAYRAFLDSILSASIQDTHFYSHLSQNKEKKNRSDKQRQTGLAGKKKCFINVSPPPLQMKSSFFYH